MEGPYQSQPNYDGRTPSVDPPLGLHRPATVATPRAASQTNSTSASVRQAPQHQVNRRASVQDEPESTSAQQSDVSPGVRAAAPYRLSINRELDAERDTQVRMAQTDRRLINNSALNAKRENQVRMARINQQAAVHQQQAAHHQQQAARYHQQATMLRLQAEFQQNEAINSRQMPTGAQRYPNRSGAVEQQNNSTIDDLSRAAAGDGSTTTGTTPHMGLRYPFVPSVTQCHSTQTRLAMEEIVLRMQDPQNLRSLYPIHRELIPNTVGLQPREDPLPTQSAQVQATRSASTSVAEATSDVVDEASSPGTLENEDTAEMSDEEGTIRGWDEEDEWESARV